MNMIFARCFTIIVTIAFVEMLSACAPEQTLKVHDDHSSTISARATLRPDAWSSSNKRIQGGIEVGYEQFKGKDSQQLPAGTSASIGSGFINGPDTLNNTATVHASHIAATLRVSFGPHLQIEPLLGVTNISTNFQVTPVSSGATFSEQTNRTYFLFGAMPRWRFNHWIALEGRFTRARGASDTSDNLSVGALLNPTPNVGLRLGYSQRNYNNRGYNLTSDLDIRAKGPSASLVFDF
jgi:hypothetical protein